MRRKPGLEVRLQRASFSLIQVQPGSSSLSKSSQKMGIAVVVSVGTEVAVGGGVVGVAVGRAVAVGGCWVAVGSGVNDAMMGWGVAGMGEVGEQADVISARVKKKAASGQIEYLISGSPSLV